MDLFLEWKYGVALNDGIPYAVTSNNPYEPTHYAFRWMFNAENGFEVWKYINTTTPDSCAWIIYDLNNSSPTVHEILSPFDCCELNNHIDLVKKTCIGDLSHCEIGMFRLQHVQGDLGIIFSHKIQNFTRYLNQAGCEIMCEKINTIVKLVLASPTPCE